MSAWCNCIIQTRVVTEIKRLAFLIKTKKGTNRDVRADEKKIVHMWAARRYKTKRNKATARIKQIFGHTLERAIFSFVRVQWQWSGYLIDCAFHDEKELLFKFRDMFLFIGVIQWGNYRMSQFKGDMSAKYFFAASAIIDKCSFQVLWC